jgi:hypothetical protein
VSRATPSPGSFAAASAGGGVLSLSGVEVVAEGEADGAAVVAESSGAAGSPEAQPASATARPSSVAVELRE